MAYTVKFYNFAKKVNSTAVPSSAGTSYDCIVKAETGILSPQVQLSLPAGTAPLYNYAYISAFNRYYWVSEWTFQNGLWTADLEVDPMGSYKSSIGAANLYILRAANAKDGKIIDTHYPICSFETKDIKQAASIWFSSVSTVDSGCFIVGLRGRINSSQTAGGITYLAMTPAQFKAFTEDLFNDQLNNYIAGGALDIGNTLACMIFNPTQYIASCMWLPGTPTSESTATGFNVGWWGFTSGSKIVSSMSALFYSASLACEAHPQASDRGIYLNGAPFTSRQLVLPRFGTVDITNQIPANADTINIELIVDPISGQGLYNLGYELVGDSTNVIFDQIQCQIGVDLPLSSNQVTVQEAVAAVGSVANSFMDAAQFNGVGAVADIASALSVLQPHINDISSASGFLGYSGAVGTPYIISRFKEVAADDNTEEGSPLCQIRQVSNLGGYMKALHGDLAIAAATQTELDSIRQYLTDGFYYE